MKLMRVPFRCATCTRTGIYITSIEHYAVQLMCHSCGDFVQTQVPLSEIEVEVQNNTSTFEFLDDVV